MAINAQALNLQNQAVYTLTDGSNTLTLEILPFTFSYTPPKYVAGQVADSAGGLYAVTNEGRQREAWPLSVSCKAIDFGENGDTEETLRRIIDALMKDNLAGIDTGSAWASTNPLTGGGRGMLDFKIVYSNVGGETATFNAGAVWVDTYTYTDAEGGAEVSINFLGVEEPAWTDS